MRTTQHGFTLIEMLIASAIAAILAATAYPSFTGVLLKARRSDGIVSLMQIQMSQERSYSNQRRYMGLADLGIPAISQQRQYRTVTLGPLVDGLRVARSGLKPGDRIVVNGLQRVRPGAPVAPEVVTMAAAAAASAPVRQ